MTNAETGPVLTSGPTGPMSGYEPANLADILERVLDRGLVVVGDIRVNLLDIELLTIKLRLVIASLETAKQVGLDWWERDPWYTGGDGQVRQVDEHPRSQLSQEEVPRRRTKPIEGRSVRRPEEEQQTRRGQPIEGQRRRRSDA
jgi:gas vesicle protein GvpA/GvpJ/GvpM family